MLLVFPEGRKDLELFGLILFFSLLICLNKVYRPFMCANMYSKPAVVWCFLGGGIQKHPTTLHSRPTLVFQANQHYFF